MKSRLLCGIQNEENIGVPKKGDGNMTFRMENKNLKLENKPSLRIRALKYKGNH